jgi:hypothetical protein
MALLTRNGFLIAIVRGRLLKETRFKPTTQPSINNLRLNVGYAIFVVRMVCRGRKKTRIQALHGTENRVFLEELQDVREQAGMTQIDLGLRLGRTQNYVSTTERGAIRLDGLQLRDWCQACGTDLVSWAREIESQLSASGKLPAGKRKQA